MRFLTTLLLAVSASFAGDDPVSQLELRFDESGGPILDRSRLAACLESIEAAEAWPKLVLVVQDEQQDQDFIIGLERDEDGNLAPIDLMVRLPRREWDVDGVRDAIKEATGRKPRGRKFNVVVQGFSRTTVEHFVYEAPAKPTQGLMALLPEGTLLREAQPARVGGAPMLTLALVFHEAELLASDCAGEQALRRGHVDVADAALVLAGDEEIVAQRELGRLRIPRAGCDGPGDPAAIARGPALTVLRPVPGRAGAFELALADGASVLIETAGDALAVEARPGPR